MTRARLKQQPLDKTIVTEFKVTVADIHLRKRAIGGSIAKRVSSDTDFVSGDADCGPNKDFTISGIKTAVMVHGFRSFTVSIRYGSGEIVDVPCHGLFVFYGELDSVTVKSSEPTRFSYVRS